MIWKMCTYETIYEKGKKYEIGDLVTVYKQIRHENGIVEVRKKEGKILERYTHHMVVGTSEGYSREESFSYTDVVLFRKVRHILGRPKKIEGVLC